MLDRPLYDRAIFWLGLGGPVAAIGGILLGIGVAQVVTKPNGNLWANAWFDLGLAVVVVGAGLLDWSLVIYLAHGYVEAHASPAPIQAISAKRAPIAASPTMIARPYGLGQQPDITVEITEHEWTRTPIGRLILRTKLRIQNSNQGAVRTIRQHWLICPGYPNANYGPLSLQTRGLSQQVGPVKPGETLEGHIYSELPNADPKGPGDYDLYFEDDLGRVTKATKPGSV